MPNYRDFAKDVSTDDFTEEDQKRFQDPVYYKKFRREVESGLNVRTLQLRHSIYKAR